MSSVVALGAIGDGVPLLVLLSELTVRFIKYDTSAF